MTRLQEVNTFSSWTWTMCGCVGVMGERRLVCLAGGRPRGAVPEGVPHPPGAHRGQGQHHAQPDPPELHLHPARRQGEKDRLDPRQRPSQDDAGEVRRLQASGCHRVRGVGGETSRQGQISLDNKFLYL